MKELVANGESYLKTQAQLAENRTLLESEPAESEMSQLAREEIARLEAGEKKLGQQLQFGLIPPDPTDSRNTIVEIRAGDVVWCPPGHKHWHGATPTTAMTHIAIQEALDGKNVEWLEKVTDAEYLAGPQQGAERE